MLGASTLSPSALSPSALGPPAVGQSELGPRDLGLPALGAAVLAGNCVVQFLPELPPAGALVALVLVVPLLLRFRATHWLAWAALAFAWTVTAAHARLADRWTGPTRDIPLVGWIDGFPERSPERVVFSLRVVEAAEGVPTRVRLSWYDAPDGLKPGASLEIVARLRSPRGLSNPGVFDYERWLFVAGVGASGYVRSGAVVAGRAPTLPQRWLELRAGLAERIERAARSDAGGDLVVALTLGERYGFTDQQWADLRRTGTTHLVAISGLHVGLLAALCYALVRALCLRAAPLAPRSTAIAAVVAVVVALAYCALAGFAVPAQRSLVMVVVALVVAAGRRLVGRFDAFAAAVVVVLAGEPLATLSASFWLSYGAVGALLVLASRETLAFPSRALWPRIRRAAGSTVRLQLGITLALVPLSAFFFGELSLISPLVNLVAIPVFGFGLVPLCLVAAALLGLGVDVGFVALAAMLADGFWQAIGAASAWRWAAMPLPAPGLVGAVVAAAAALLALPAHALPGRRLLWLGLVPLFVIGPARPEPGRADVLVIDVGQGLAVLVATARHAVLYDAGPVFRSGFDTGSEIVLPVLASRGIERLDMLVVSHADLDHAGGAPAVHAAYPTAQVVKGPDVVALPGQTCVAGQRFSFDGVDFEFLHPAPEFAPRGNDSSCVLKVVTRGESLLIAGDIEARGERALRGNPKLAADILVVPHHGSLTSSSPAFVAAVRPRLAIVSAAYDNRWGMPRPEVRRRFENAGARMLITANAGAIAFELGATGGAVPRLQRPAASRYWHARSEPSAGDGRPGAL